MPDNFDVAWCDHPPCADPREGGTGVELTLCAVPQLEPEAISQRGYLRVTVSNHLQHGSIVEARDLVVTAIGKGASRRGLG